MKEFRAMAPVLPFISVLSAWPASSDPSLFDLDPQVTWPILTSPTFLPARRRCGHTVETGASEGRAGSHLQRLPRLPVAPPDISREREANERRKGGEGCGRGRHGGGRGVGESGREGEVKGITIPVKYRTSNKESRVLAGEERVQVCWWDLYQQELFPTKTLWRVWPRCLSQLGFMSTVGLHVYCFCGAAHSPLEWEVNYRTLHVCLARKGSIPRH